MATIEVHHGQGRVERLTITRDQTILFGSSPKCDIVLSGERVLPFHGRMRWKRDRFKVDASPDAEYLSVNGHKMTSSSFRQGDEIAIGPNRIFMIRVEEDLPRDERTRIQPPPIRPGRRYQDAAPSPPPDDRTRGQPQVHPRHRPWQEPDWWDDLEVAPPSVETSIATPGPTSQRGRDVPEAILGARGSPPARPWSRFVSLLTSGDRPPGQEHILTSPLVGALALALVVLVVLGISLRGIIAETVATRQYNRAVENLDNGDDRNAIRQFDTFLAANPDNRRAGKARVLRALANVRQFAVPSAGSWSHALEAEKTMVETVAKEPAYRDVSTELAELVLKTGEALADRAKVTADPRALAEAETTVALHARVAGPAAASFLTRSRLPARLAEARAAVRKESIRGQALAAMDAALKEGSSARVYAARDALVRQYADLADDRALVEWMTRANDLIRHAVTIDTTTQPAETTPHPEPFGPPSAWSSAQPSRPTRLPRPRPRIRPVRSSSPRPTGSRTGSTAPRARPSGRPRSASPRRSLPGRSPAARRRSSLTPGTTSWSGSRPAPAGSSGDRGSASP